MHTSGSYGDELPPGETLCGGQYTIDRFLNSGGFGVTYMARDSLGRRVVIKECFPSAMCYREGRVVRLRPGTSGEEFDAILELFEKEARALAALQHPYIVGVHQFFRDNATAYMAMDFVDGRTLLDIIENDPDRLGPEDVKELLIRILQALSYTHSHDILHRDISPDNILVDADNMPVLIDFGAARESATRMSRVLSKVLTVKDGYSPQEFYLAGSDQAYSSDLYALAATFYHVVSCKAPPSSHSRLAATAREQPDPLDPLDDDVPGYDSHFIGAINRCLSVFPRDRLQTAAAWRDAIDVDRRQQAAMREAEQDQELERRVAELVAEFEREWAEREARMRAALEAQQSLSDEDRIRMEAEARAQAEAEERAREEAAAEAQAEAEEIQAILAAERAARAAARAAAESQQQRRAHTALQKRTGRDDAVDTIGSATEPSPGRAAPQTAQAGATEPATDATQTAAVLPRRVQATSSEKGSATARPPRGAASIDLVGNQSGPAKTGSGPVRRALFGGRIALSVGGKGSKP